MFENDENKMHRVLINVLSVYIKDNEKYVDLVIPSWNPDIVMDIPCKLFRLLDDIKSGDCLLGDVNIDAPSTKELKILLIEIMED